MCMIASQRFQDGPVARLYDVTTKPKPELSIESEDSAQLSSLGRGDRRKSQVDLGRASA